VFRRVEVRVQLEDLLGALLRPLDVVIAGLESRVDVLPVDRSLPGVEELVVAHDLERALDQPESAALCVAALQ
jgi:hypothetical protein